MDASLQSWALPRIKRLLPLDDDALIDILTYALSAPKAEAADHLKHLLGESPAAFEFISGFSNRRPEAHQPPPAPETAPAPAPAVEPVAGVPRPRKQVPKKAKPPLHDAGPVRQPAGYGNVAGGYQKNHDPDALQVPKAIQSGILSTSSRDTAPAPAKGPPSAAGNLISDFMPNVRSRTAKKSAGHASARSSSSPKTNATTTTASIADLTSAIAALELATNPTRSSELRHCDCNATIHPLFTTAPNCLHCGKIICALEGLQPCSFCSSPLLTRDQVNAMIKALKEERGVERMVQHNVGVAQARSGTSTPRFGASGSPSTPDSGDEAARARAHRDKLLAFQRENAQRTKIHDEAADYDTTLAPGATRWMSPMQRAAALKKQQQYLRELEEANRPEWEKKRTVMSLGFKNGKLVKTYDRPNTASAPAPSQDAAALAEPGVADDDAEAGGNQRFSLEAKAALSNNPLLQGGQLVRPVWKAAGADAKGKAKAEDGEDASGRERRGVWRRVQDEYENDEDWILDGGLGGSGPAVEANR